MQRKRETRHVPWKKLVPLGPAGRRRRGEVLFFHSLSPALSVLSFSIAAFPAFMKPHTHTHTTCSSYDPCVCACRLVIPSVKKKKLQPAHTADAPIATPARLPPRRRGNGVYRRAPMTLPDAYGNGLSAVAVDTGTGRLIRRRGKKHILSVPLTLFF